MTAGHNFTVKFDIHNIGDSPAYDVTVNDQWPATYDGADGFNMLEVARL